MRFAADLNPDERPFERDERTFVIDILAAFCNALLGPLFCAGRTLDVDLLRPFGGLGKNTHLSGKHLDKTPCDGKPEPAFADSISKLTDFQFRKEWGMTGKDAEVSLGARDLKLFNLLVNKRSVRSD